MNIRGLTFLLVLHALYSQGRAEEIPIANHSFEDPAYADGGFTEAAFPGWTGVGPYFGVANPANDYFSGTTDGGAGESPIDGLNAAHLNVGSKLIYQDPLLVVQPNVAYRLTLLAGHRIGVPFGTGSISFWAGTDLLAQAFPDPPEDRFVAASLTYTSPPAGTIIGQPLRIELTTTGEGAQAWFDDVHLFSETLICTPHKAKATLQVVNGFVVGATITEPGCGYTNTPLVLIQGGGGNGATATATVSDGRVVFIHIVSAGCCYTNTPSIVIASPPFVPSLTISVSKVKVTQHVVLGRRYVLESSDDSVTWTPTGPSFTADSETVEAEFDTEGTGKRFRIREVP